ncbi:hypothetical protein [Nocardia paucivorans]|uniref:hypothetical protein n=1 Tax=Nocardia paucivorans TaxID=114259 RepID=UPI000592FBB6|nr:hypothetical protein [Nocardia paucivorans]
MVAVEILAWGLVAGLVHTVAMVILYGNPWVARIHAAHNKVGAAGAQGRAAPASLSVQFLGTQVEVYLLTIGYAWLHPLLPLPGLVGALALGVFMAALRVFAPVWALWRQGTYSGGYLFVEVLAGVLGSVVVMLTLYLLF